jgi:hypothetical protein
MENMRILLGNALAGSLDAAMGALIAAAALSALGVQPTLWHLAFGSLLAVLPDFDMLVPILLGREVRGNHHVTLMHRPLLIIPAAALAAYLIGGQAWSLVAFLCVSWHYLHDTPPLGVSGIAWLWPIDYRYWSPRGPEEPHMAGYTHHAWLKKYWMRLSPTLCMEVGAGLMAITLALFIALRTV